MTDMSAIRQKIEVLLSKKLTVSKIPVPTERYKSGYLRPMAAENPSVAYFYDVVKYAVIEALDDGRVYVKGTPPDAGFEHEVWTAVEDLFRPLGRMTRFA